MMQNAEYGSLHCVCARWARPGPTRAQADRGPTANAASPGIARGPLTNNHLQMAFAECNQEVGTFYKRGCQEKYFPASLNERQISTGIQPRDIGARGCTQGCTPRGPFGIRPFPLGRRRS
jgi:hypothetical protein